MDTQGRLDQLKAECGYDDDEALDTLIAYKDALEDRCRSLESCVAAIGEMVPVNDEWNGGPGRLEDIAVRIDRCGVVPRPETSDYLRH